MAFEALARYVPPRVVAWSAVAVMVAFVTFVGVLVLAIAVGFEFKLAGVAFGRNQQPVATDGTSALPPGVVVASTMPCGNLGGAWAPFEEGAGKFLLGAGTGRLVYRGEHHQPPNVGNVVALKPVEFGDQGGAETHTLTIEEMPLHSHYVPSKGKGGPEDVYALASTGLGHYEGPHQRPTSLEGGRDAHNNMPPYISLYFCKKND